MFRVTWTMLTMAALASAVGCGLKGTRGGEIEDAPRTWAITDQIEFTAGSSGDRRPGETLIMWGTLVGNGGYIDGAIEYAVTQPDGTVSDTIQMRRANVAFPGDPNFESAFTPTQAGRHAVTFRLSVKGQEEQSLEGLSFHVDQTSI